MDIVVKCIINIFTIIDGKINLLVKGNNELIKIDCLDSFDIVCNKYIKENIKINGLDLKQVYTFSKKSDKLNIEVLYIDIINIDNIKLNNKFKFIELNKLDSNIYIDKSIEYLKKELVLNSTIKKLYPNEFVLPEIQKVYENLLGKKYDRRNFRKRLIKLDIIEDLEKFCVNKAGRPAKLYKFKNLQEDKALF